MLDDRVVVLAGGTGDLGRSLALRCAEEDAYIIVAGADRDAGAEIQARIESGGGDCAFVEVDLDDEDSIQSMIAEAILVFGSVNALVNCPQDHGRSDALSTSNEEWENVMNRDLRAAWLSCKYALPFLKQGRGGAVVNVASADALASGSRHLLTSTAHAGLLAMTRSMAVDYGPHDIRVNAVCAGFIQTDATRRALDETGDPDGSLARLTDVQPLGRLGRPEDVANAVVFLLSQQAAYITGTTLMVDGGRAIAGQDLHP